MNGTAVTTSNEWMEFYEQLNAYEVSASSSSLGFSDATVVATTDSTVHTNLISPSSSQYSGSDQLSTPKESGSSSRPIRRRSRASKKTPTTLLNANSSNFRALVQQFTGCPNTFGNRRGPINLNFALGRAWNQIGVATSIMPVSGNDYNYHQQQQLLLRQQPQPQPQQQHQYFYQEQRQQQHAAVSSGNVHHDASRSSGNAYEILEGFNLDNISLQALHRDILNSPESVNERNYFC